MARISGYDDAHDNPYWVVERSDGKSEGRKEFRTYEEAEIYKNYLQSIENEEKALFQNQQIIENQNKIIEHNRRGQTIPRIQQVRQVLDPEYEEWLRYKKATDPAYQKWKAEEELKKKQKIIEERNRALEREKEENKRYCLEQNKCIASYKERIERYGKVYKQIVALYEKVLNISFISSEKIHYYVYGDGPYDGYPDDFQITEGFPLIYDGSKPIIKTHYDSLNNNLRVIGDINVFCNNLFQLSKEGKKHELDSKIRILSNTDNSFNCFYRVFYEGLKKRVEWYTSYSNPNFCSNRWPAKRVGLFTKQKLKRAINDYLKNNDRNYKTAKDIYQQLIVLLRTCDVIWLY